jgi:hypothetical protein
MEVLRLDVEGHAPTAVGAIGDGREENLRASRAKHAPERSRALAHDELAELRQAKRARRYGAEADRASGAGALVANAEGRTVGGLLLEPRKARRSASTCLLPTRGECGERVAQIHGAFLEDLLADFGAPREARQTAVVDTRGGRQLPAVEGVDEIESRPGHLHVVVVLLRGERVLDDAQALVEGEARGANVPAERLFLRGARQQREAERRVAAHPSHRVSVTSVAATSTKPAYDADVLS